MGNNHLRPTTQRNRDRERLRRTGAPCHICGLPIDYSLKWPDPQSFVADHVQALARGGDDRITNKLAAHKVCNERKSTKTHAAGIIRRSGALN